MYSAGLGNALWLRCRTNLGLHPVGCIITKKYVMREVNQKRNISPESQKTEYKSSWQEEYFGWICGYANAKGGTIYIGVNDDGYVMGLNDTRYLLDTLPNQIVSTMGIVVEIDHDTALARGANIKYNSVPDDIAQKPENLYVRGFLTEKALADIIADPDNTTNVTNDIQKLFNAAPGFVKQLRKSEQLRNKVLADLSIWQKENPVHISDDGSLVSYEGLQRIETFMTPREAFREVVLNAINHKLYESGNPIQISVYEDQIVVFNQGKWPEDITLESLYEEKHSSYPHNPSLNIPRSVEPGVRRMRATIPF